MWCGWVARPGHTGGYLARMRVFVSPSRPPVTTASASRWKWRAMAGGFMLESAGSRQRWTGPRRGAAPTQTSRPWSRRRRSSVGLFILKKSCLTLTGTTARSSGSDSTERISVVRAADWMRRGPPMRLLGDFWAGLHIPPSKVKGNIVGRGLWTNLRLYYLSTRKSYPPSGR